MLGWGGGEDDGPIVRWHGRRKCVRVGGGGREPPTPIFSPRFSVASEWKSKTNNNYHHKHKKVWMEFLYHVRVGVSAPLLEEVGGHCPSCPPPPGSCVLVRWPSFDRGPGGSHGVPPGLLPWLVCGSNLFVNVIHGIPCKDISFTYYVWWVGLYYATFFSLSFVFGYLLYLPQRQSMPDAI